MPVALMTIVRDGLYRESLWHIYATWTRDCLERHFFTPNRIFKWKNFRCEMISFLSSLCIQKNSLVLTENLPQRSRTHARKSWSEFAKVKDSAFASHTGQTRYFTMVGQTWDGEKYCSSICCPNLQCQLKSEIFQFEKAKAGSWAKVLILLHSVSERVSCGTWCTPSPCYCFLKIFCGKEKPSITVKVNALVIFGEWVLFGPSFGFPWSLCFPVSKKKVCNV